MGFKITLPVLLFFLLAGPATPQIEVDPLSVTSLLVLLVSNNVPIASATAFVVEKNSKYYLVSNWHVITGRRPDSKISTDEQGRLPDQIKILQNTKDHLGNWHWVSENLIDAKTHAPRWIEHPTLKNDVDLALLPLENTDGIQFYPLDLELRNKSVKLSPGGEVSIVGFPFGNASYLGLPIWKAGAIASDPDINYMNSPQFLVDTTSRPGMSGSPVYARRFGSYQDEKGNLVLGTGVTDRFLGVYAGDIDSQSEVGRIWKATALMEIYDSIK